MPNQPPRDMHRAGPSESLEEWEILDALDELAEKSLVQYETDGGGNGLYYLLETVREYAADLLADTGEAPGIQRRHREYFTQLAEEVDAEGPDAAAWLDRLEADHGNLRKALESALDDPDDRLTALRLAGSLHWFWDTRGHLAEGLHWCERALEHGAADAAERAEALQGAGNLSHSRADYATAERYHSQSLAIRRTLGDIGGVGRSLGSLAKAALNQGDEARAAKRFAESLNASREAGDRPAETATLINYGILLGGQDDHAGARALFEAARRLCSLTGNQRMLLYAVSCLATEAFYMGDYACARERHLEALGHCRKMGDKINIAYTLEGLATAALATREFGEAARLYGAAAALREAIGAPPRPPNRAAIDEDYRALRVELGEEAMDRAIESGRDIPLEKLLTELLTAPQP